MVRHPGLPFEVEPAFARYVVTGLVVIWQSGQARADALDRAGLHPGIHESGRPDQHRSISG
ncbi:hypothetical protein BJF85_09045 [Saccharomonospora sp. CUA-673]|uniref:hypothetical protein n=1 Tax=Saccharomonospora sp. CUA-673 TaxID=1904969 RepID=UPI0009698CBF|nr:hypothetical protein [Saccharomonospora sp. CUA-673]OLT38480.1 hypothetical protein BJF85_09045 [Saccharomonospora sp. CUA-673]